MIGSFQITVVKVTKLVMEYWYRPEYVIFPLPASKVQKGMTVLLVGVRLFGICLALLSTQYATVHKTFAKTILVVGALPLDVHFACFNSPETARA